MLSRRRLRRFAAIAGALTFTLGAATANAADEKPVRGGVLDFVVGSKIPSYDGHRESTFGMIQPIAPFYSLLLRVNPANPTSPTDIICDLCEGTWTESDDGLTYTFAIRQNVKFHDGTPLTSADIKASLDKIIFPPEKIPSTRQSWYSQVAAVETPEPYKLVVKMKRRLPAIIPALASPFNFIYSKKDLDTHGYNWHKTNINGTGAFVFKEHQLGAFVEGKRNPDYYIEGRPYLDGYRAISAPKMSIRTQSLRGDRAGAEFRGFPPKARDDLVNAMGDKIVIQEFDWNNIMGAVANERIKKFQDPRVRQALAYAIDRVNTVEPLSQVAIIKTIGGMFFPKHPLAAKKEFLETLPGYSPDVAASRAKAKQLLKEAGQENLKLTLWNRAVDQPYKLIGTWYIGEWRKIGIDAEQRVVPSGPWYAGLQTTRDYEVSIDFNGQTIVNPTLDVSKWVCGTGHNYSNCDDPKTGELYNAMLDEPDPAKQYEKARAYEKYVLEEQAHWIPAFWWYRIVAHRDYVKGWKIGPSHLLNQSLDTVWIDPKLR